MQIPCGPIFTPNNQLVYCAYQDEKRYMVVDGVLGNPYDRIYLSPSRAVPMHLDKGLEYIALKGSTVVRVSHSLVPNGM